MHNTNTETRAIAYLRVSTSSQSEKGIAIPTQKEACLKFLKEQDYECDERTDIYTDGGLKGSLSEYVRSLTGNISRNQMITWESCFSQMKQAELIV